jgi:hypothetical protein
VRDLEAIAKRRRAGGNVSPAEQQKLDKAGVSPPPYKEPTR